MDRSNSLPNEQQMAALRAIETEKAAKALENIKTECRLNAGKIREELHAVNNKIGTWSTKQIQAFVREINLDSYKPLIVPDDPMSVEQYEEKITAELVKDLYKRKIAHHTNPKTAEALLISRQKAWQAEKMSKEGAPEEAVKEIQKEAKDLWQKAHQISPEEEKMFRVLGEGTYGKAEAVASKEGGPLVVKKTLLPGADPLDREDFAQEQTNLKALDHPNIIRIVSTATATPATDSDSFHMESGGAPLSLLIKGDETGETNLAGLQNIDRHAAKQREQQQVSRFLIQGLIAKIATKQCAADTYDQALQQIQQIRKTANFTQDNIDQLLENVLTWKQATNDPQILGFLEQLTAVYNAWKAILPSSPPQFGGSLSMDKVKHITEQAARGLAHLHENNMVHLDVKTDNIVLQPDGTVKLIDFGMAMPLEDYRANPVPCGSPRFMAPEVLRRMLDFPDTCDERVDVYAFGCVLHELITGERYNDPSNYDYDDDDSTYNAFLQNVGLKTNDLQSRMKTLINKRYLRHNPGDVERQKTVAEVTDLLTKMLHPKAAERISMKEVLQHPFFAK